MRVRARQSNERVDIVGIDGERTRSQKPRALGAQDFHGSDPYCTKPKPENRGPSSRGSQAFSRASRLGGGKLGVERVRQAGDDFVLHVEEIGERLIEPLGPEMTARLPASMSWTLDPHPVSAALDAALKDIADIQLAPNRLHVERLAFVSEGRIAGDHDPPLVSTAEKGRWS